MDTEIMQPGIGASMSVVHESRALSNIGDQGTTAIARTNI
jgi:hypothetical protein